MGVAMYFIDKLALRAGHEKEEDEADTVGCCNLKVGTRFALCCAAGRCSGRTTPAPVHDTGGRLQIRCPLMSAVLEVRAFCFGLQGLTLPGTHVLRASAQVH